MIEFTQYLLPNGEKRSVFFEAPSGIDDLAKRIVNRGGRFEIEILRNDHVSITCEIDDNNGETRLLAILVVPNGPAIVEHVHRVVKNAASALGLTMFHE